MRKKFIVCKINDVAATYFIFGCNIYSKNLGKKL